MRLFQISDNNDEILRSLIGFGLVMIEGGRLEVRNKIRSIELIASEEIKKNYMLSFTINKDTICELAILYNLDFYDINSSKDMARAEFNRITGRDLSSDEFV